MRRGLDEEIKMKREVKIGVKNSEGQKVRRKRRAE